MKTIILALVCIPVFTYGQDFKYQARANVLPMEKLNYAGGFRLGFETVNRKWNWGVDIVNYLGDNNERTTYKQDSIVRISKSSEYVDCHGLAFSVLKSIPFRQNSNRWIIGASIFSGFSKQTNFIESATYDTSRGYIGAWQIPNHDLMITHGPKWNFALAFLVRLELNVSRRFTLTPEFNLPIMIFNDIGGQIYSRGQAGFNLCVGYRLGRKRTAA